MEILSKDNSLNIKQQKIIPLKFLWHSNIPNDPMQLGDYCYDYNVLQ